MILRPVVELKFVLRVVRHLLWHVSLKDVWLLSRSAPCHFYVLTFMTSTDQKSASEPSLSCRGLKESEGVTLPICCFLFSPQCFQQKPPTSATPTTPCEETTPSTSGRPGTLKAADFCHHEVLWTIWRIRMTDKLNQHICGVFMFTDSRKRAWTAPKTWKDNKWKPSERRQGSRRMVTWKTKAKKNN